MSGGHRSRGRPGAWLSCAHLQSEGPNTERPCQNASLLPLPRKEKLIFEDHPAVQLSYTPSEHFYLFKVFTVFHVKTLHSSAGSKLLVGRIMDRMSNSTPPGGRSEAWGTRCFAALGLCVNLRRSMILPGRRDWSAPSGCQLQTAGSRCSS